MTARAWLGLAVIAMVAAGGCSVDPYCITCKKADGQVDTDGRVFDDGGVREACIYLGPEVCNGIDDDCDGVADDGILRVGEPCGTDEGMCERGSYQCTSDGEVVCMGGVQPAPEDCNGVDDDCDGMVDDGDPGGGQPCGMDVGDCERGMTACVDAEIVCVGEVFGTDEVCDGRDNDCDGVIDDGNPGGGAVCMPGMDACTTGFERCIGGEILCRTMSGPTREECDGIDNDCDMETDEDFDLQNDANNCGACGTTCMAPNARTFCATGMCLVSSCLPDFWDIDGTPDNGCEYSCRFRGAEICNGVDDDCDRDIDEDLVTPTICAAAGECAGTTASCSGVDGWECTYGPNVSTGPGGEIVPETDCDGRDDDCDGVADDSFTMLGTECARGTGACRTMGVLECNDTEDGLACNAPDPPPGTMETCNGIDDDCDGVFDEGAEDEWVTFTMPGGASMQIYKYEASRPDASATQQGTMLHRPCSAANRLPWSNVTHPEAEAACAAIGARLCSESEWQRACETGSSPACTWAYGTQCRTFQPNACNGNEYDADPGSAGDQDALAATGSFPQCHARWSPTARIFDLTGNLREWTAERAPGINPLRGGAYNNIRDGLTCQTSFVVAGDEFLFANVGFRCCRPTPP